MSELLSCLPEVSSGRRYLGSDNTIQSPLKADLPVVASVSGCLYDVGSFESDFSLVLYI